MDYATCFSFLILKFLDLVHRNNQNILNIGTLGWVGIFIGNQPSTAPPPLITFFIYLKPYIQGNINNARVESYDPITHGCHV